MLSLKISYQPVTAILILSYFGNRTKRDKTDITNITNIM